MLFDPLGRQDDEIDIQPGRKLLGRVDGLLAARGRHFVTTSVSFLDLGFSGIVGDLHEGVTRRTGGREPWYPRGTEIRNERQVSIVAQDELETIADRMAVTTIIPEWLGANLVLSGVRRLSMLPAGTFLFFKGGVTLKVDGPNTPCRLAGRAVAEGARMADPEAGAMAFPKAAKRLRGIVAWVEKPGRITVGEDVSVRIPEQWIYR